MATGYFASTLCLAVIACLSVPVVPDTSGDCREQAFMCFEKLRDAVKSNTPNNVDDFLCGADQKASLHCVIEKFQECPNLKNASFIDELDYNAFHAVDLFTVTSSDQYCKCCPTWRCLNDIKEDQLFKDGQAGSTEFPKLANKEYICGAGKKNIECVAKNVPECKDYLQHKRNESSADFFDVNHLVFAEAFKKKRCDTDTKPEVSLDCTKKRTKWLAMEECVEQAKRYVVEEKKQCGVRRCLDIHMTTCPAGEKEYFIDSANVYSDVKISDKPCSSAYLPLLSTVSAIFVLCFHLAL